jgi:hypothetical protein
MYTNIYLQAFIPRLTNTFFTITLYQILTFQAKKNTLNLWKWYTCMNEINWYYFSFLFYTLLNNIIKRNVKIWYSVIVKNVFVNRGMNACKYMFVYILHTFLKCPVSPSLTKALLSTWLERNWFPHQIQMYDCIKFLHFKLKKHIELVEVIYMYERNKLILLLVSFLHFIKQHY